ncbi:MAG: IS30 family transposase, partial [Gammaproteobacteria bacterium]|nr:IS30 family transposase [Gammaproteobacteria bacterium]
LAIKNSGKNSVETAAKIIKTVSGGNNIYFNSCTFDKAGEFAQHQKIAKQLKAQTYFSHPYASYQKGSVEQGNGMARVELPRSADLANMKQTEINRIMKNINNRPMALHNGESPSEIFRSLIGNKLKGVVALPA